MGNELRHFVPEFLEFRKACKAQGLDIPFLFHCGETLGVGTVVDGNLFDAILLNSKRIGHGYAAARHPLIMDLLKEKNIAIESCPISNEVLGLTPVTAGHHLPILLANDVPCTINSDNATFYRYVFICNLLDARFFQHPAVQKDPYPPTPYRALCNYNETYS